MIDETDIRLLAALQQNAQLTAHELGGILGLSPSQAGRRRQRLEQSGLIRGYIARLDPVQLGLGIQAFVQVEMAAHKPAVAKSFMSLLDTRAEVVSAWTLTGTTDYLLRVYCTDLGALNQLIQEVLLAHAAVAKVHSQIVMGQCKSDAPLPL